MINRRKILQFLAGASTGLLTGQKVLGKAPEGKTLGDQDSYHLGKGELTFRTWNARGEEFEIVLGHVTEFDVYTEVDEQEHWSTDGGKPKLNSKIEISRILSFSGKAEADPEGNMMTVKEQL